jgi:hypothetical protein
MEPIRCEQFVVLARKARDTGDVDDVRPPMKRLEEHRDIVLLELIRDPAAVASLGEGRDGPIRDREHEYA